MSELKKNVTQKPDDSQMICISCKKETRCNYNLTGKKDPLCESCYLKGLVKVEELIPVKEILSSNLIFRIYQIQADHFAIEVDENRYQSDNNILHFTLDKNFISLIQAEEFISYYLGNLRMGNMRRFA